MNRFTISTRLKFLSLVLGALMVFVGCIGLYGMKQGDSSLEKVYVDHAVGLGLLNEVEFQALRNRLTLSNAARDPSADRIKKYTERVEKSIPEMLAVFDTFMKGNLSEHDSKLARLYGDSLNKYVKDGLLPVVVALRANDITQANVLLEKSTGVLYDDVHAHGVTLMKLQLTDGQKEFDLAVDRFGKYQTISVVSMVAGLCFALWFGYLLVRSITVPLSQALRMAEAIAAGDLTQTLLVDKAYAGSDEVSNLMRSFSRMQTNLVQIVSRVRVGSESIAAASSEIAQGNQELSNRTESQASALVQTSLSMAELNETVRQNANSAESANSLAASASQIAVQGGDEITKVVCTMHGIEESANQISDIIAVIDGIAFQTNILALNAAVEAARAGETGRGFAVVASEVRNLAGRSAEAAKQIRTLIQTSVERTRAGSELVDQARATMNQVVASIRTVTQTLEQISAASAAQSQGVEQVDLAVGHMDQVTQQNAALVQQMAAATGGLKSQALALVQTVSVFKLGAVLVPAAVDSSSSKVPLRTFHQTVTARSKPLLRSTPAFQFSSMKPGVQSAGELQMF